MSGDEDWLMRPVLRGLCKYESLKGFELDLHDFAVMNEAIDVEIANRELITDWVKKQDGHR